MKETIQKIRSSLSPYYSAGEIESFIRIIFENLLNYSPVDIIMHKDSELSDFMRAKIDKVIARLIEKEPIQYIFGETYFYGHKFAVTSDTLIPRPETQELIDIIVKDNQQSDLRVLDIGTGSGCIAISLALALRFPIVEAIDISDRALEVAKENARSLHANVNFAKQDILAITFPASPQYDIIVSNPPYICEKEKPSIDKNVLDYEPHSALFVPDNNPLLFYRAIAEYSVAALNVNGRLYFEINNQYADITAKMLIEPGFDNIEIIKDIHNQPRFISAVKSERR